MGIIEIASIATALLTEFFKSAISEIAKKSIEGLFGTIKAKMSEKSNGKKAIDEFQNSPNDNDKQQEFEKQFLQQMKKDTEFAKKIEMELLPILQHKEIGVFINRIGKVNKFIQIDNMSGNIKM